MPFTDDVVVRRKKGVQAEATERRRAVILEAAIDAFTEHGYNGTSLRDVASRAGISHTGLLHHFPDKAALLEAAMDGLFASTATEFDFESKDGAVVMRALIGAAERDTLDPRPLRFMALVSAEALSPTHPAHGLMLNIQKGVHVRLTEAFTDLQERGLYRPTELPPEMAATHVASLRNGAISEWLRAPDDVDFVEIVRGQLRMFTTLEL